MKYEKHNERSRSAIKAAFLDALRDKPFARMSVADVARCAGVSRSTVYAHYANLQELFEACVRDFLAGTRSLTSQLREGHCAECVEGRPFCEMVRCAEEYQALVEDAHFFPTALRYFSETGEGKRIVDDYASMGIPPQQARVLALFQMSGCFTVASSGIDVGDWPAAQAVIDDFIRGGVNAVRARA